MRNLYGTIKSTITSCAAQLAAIVSLCLIVPSQSQADVYTNYTSSFTGSDYRQALNLSLKFFGGQRCGNTHNWMLHDNPAAANICHTGDQYNGHDLTGGWHDCGDHIKVATTMGFAATSLLVAYDIWPGAFADNYDGQYGPPNGIADVLDEVKIATDYFIKSFPDRSSFVYYVGNGDYDHKVWSTSSAQSLLSVEQGGDPRPVQVSSDKGGPQAAAYSAALALMAIHYPDPAYRAQCRQAALTAWEYAQSRTGTITIPTFYPAPNPQYADEYALAGVLLARLTGDDSYRVKALGFLQGQWESNYPLAWDTFADLAYYYLILTDPGAGNGSGGTFAQFLRKNVESLAYTAGLDHPQGFPFYASRWGTNKLACGSAFAAALYADLIHKGIIVADPTKAVQFNRRIVDYMLGANEFGHPFIHGYKGDFFFKVHHRNAMGVDTNPPDSEKEQTPFLFASGALIGGPKAYNDFDNSVVNYEYTESGCDYNAPLIGALAGLTAALAPAASAPPPLIRASSNGSLRPHLRNPLASAGQHSPATQFTIAGSVATGVCKSCPRILVPNHNR